MLEIVHQPSGLCFKDKRTAIPKIWIETSPGRQYGAIYVEVKSRWLKFLFVK